MNLDAKITVSIWPLAVSSARLAALRGLLSADEQERAAKIKLESVAREFVASRGIARELLADACGCAPSELVFAVGFRGKPRIEQPSGPLGFNLSHSGGYCALAIGNYTRLGVDIEQVRVTVGDIAKNVFSPREAARYATFPPADQMRVFFRAWVAKEAYLKATGAGLAGGLKSLELDLTADPQTRPFAIDADRDAPGAWRLHGFDVSETIVGALAVETGGREVAIEVRHIEAE
jgi:4'-phosphopantetheinyl transferase